MAYEKLTLKQERFARLIFGGMEQRKAYTEAGYAPNSALSTVDAHASRLASDGKVKAKLEELREAVDDASIATVKEREKRLTVFIREDNYGKFGINRQGNIQAISELNRMDGVYEPDYGRAEARIQNFIFILPDGTRLAPKELMSGHTDRD